MSRSSSDEHDKNVTAHPHTTPKVSGGHEPSLDVARRTPGPSPFLRNQRSTDLRTATTARDTAGSPRCRGPEQQTAPVPGAVFFLCFRGAFPQWVTAPLNGVPVGIDYKNRKAYRSHCSALFRAVVRMGRRLSPDLVQQPPFADARARTARAVRRQPHTDRAGNLGLKLS